MEHSAGELRGIGGQHTVHIQKVDSPQGIGGEFSGFRLGAVEPQAKCFLHELAHPNMWVKGRHGILRDEAQRGSAKIPPLRWRHRRKRNSIKQDVSGRNAAGVVQNAHDRLNNRGFTGSARPSQSNTLAQLHGKANTAE